MVDINVFLGILQIFIQLVAAYFSYVIYKYNRLSKAWLAVTFALIIMTFRRITALSIELNVFPKFTGTIDFVDKFGLPLIISVLLFLGLWSMKKNFETFEVVEKRVKKKVRAFSKRKRR